MKLKILAAMALIVTISNFPAVAQNSSGVPAPVYASEACNSGCVIANNRDSSIYEGVTPKTYRICVGRFGAKLNVDGVLKEVPAAYSGRSCKDFNARVIILVDGEVGYGLLP
ncbi:MAG: hypothetical protein WA071_14795 [Undibacterium umbellatum]|uniref:hypothetical protein n=1 Tax=Undibacterium umbellatum TaxID=2762300 RepID=UPI003BB57BDF